MLIRDLLRRENNNFEILRLIAASGVIVGHSRAIIGDSSSSDLIGSILQFDYSGSLAVKFFFLLSGLVVTNSLLSNPNLRRFLAARVARIFPALITIVALSAYVMGPLITTDPVHAFLTNHATASYVYDNAILNAEFLLPGVFTSTPQHAVNGAIWTIPMEFFCCLLLAIIGGTGLSKNRVVFSLIVVALATSALVRPTELALFVLPSESHDMLIFFAIGTLLATWKDKISLRLETIVALLLATYVFFHTPALPYIACCAIFGAAILASTSQAALRIKMAGDFSYGTYLSGWPIQQLIHLAFPHLSAVGNWTVSLPLAIGFGVLSWYVIEKPALRLGKWLGTADLGFGRIKPIRA